MNKKIRVMALIMVMVFAVGLICGCGFTSTDTRKYRDQIAMTIGDEEIDLGAVLDAYTNYYSTYYSYISDGTYTIAQIFTYAVQSVADIYLRVSAYKSMANVPTYSNTYVGVYDDAEYLTQDEMEYVIKYSYSQLYNSLDNYVEAEVSKFADYTEPEEEEESDRDFTEYDIITYRDEAGNLLTSPYAAYQYGETLNEEDLDNRVDITNLPENYEDLLFDENDLTNALLLERVEDINDGIEYAITSAEDYVEGDEDDAELITAEDYIVYQQRALKVYSKALDDTYGYDFDSILAKQIQSALLSQIAIKYNYIYYNAVESDIDALTATLRQNWIIDKEALESIYAISADSYVTLVEGLSSSSYIYAVPAEYEHSFLYTKNLLIQFSTAQATALSNLATKVGGTDSEEYKQYRAWLASQIVAEDFNYNEANDTELDDYDDATKAANTFFNYANGATTVTLNSNTTLGQAFADGMDEAEFIELMKQYNTDTGQHTAVYDYVTRTGDLPQGYTAAFVQEYVDGANEAFASPSKYSIAISDYGVHIIFCTGEVTADIDVNASDFFSVDKIYDLSTVESRYFQEYYTSVRSLELYKAYDAYIEKLVDENKLVLSSVMQKVLDDASIDFDITEVIESMKSE